MKMIPTYHTKPKQLFIGLLSGTSMNSIDAVLVDFTANKLLILDHVNLPFNHKLADQLLMMINSGTCNLAELAYLDRQLGIEFAKAVNKLLTKSKYKPEQIIAIGSHGQNIWHAPHQKTGGVTMQIGDPNIISLYSKIVTIADFRRKDIALGGQGAPLAPSLHAAIFRSKVKTRAIINIGGISNLTLLSKDLKQPIIGFDVGPGNCLMDEWVQTHFAKLKLSYDKNGALAATGKVIPELLKICLKDPYFNKPYPKATGREYFNQAWLLQKIALAQAKLVKNTFMVSQHRSVNKKQILKFFDKTDVLTTLLHLTVHIIEQQILRLNQLFPTATIEEIYLCGGGAKNLYLLKLLKQVMNCYVGITDELGVATDLVEGVLFAWLAKQTIDQQYGNIPSVTGAKAGAILGGIYAP